MSTTPPKKGKKRAPPSMPTGWPPVKASKPSTPAATGDNPMMGFTSSLDSSAIPPFKLPSNSTAGTSKTPPLPTELTEEKPWEGDDKPEPGPLPPSFPPPTLSFTTVEEKMDNADVESSFQEFINWLWYLTQHQEQRGHQLTSCPRPHQPSGTFQGL